MTSSSVERVQDALRSRGLEVAVLEMSSSTRTAADAATTLGCKVAQIEKSLVFVSDDGRHVLVIASGANRVDEKKLAAFVGHPLKRASAEVRESSGFAIGGVPPLAHKQQPAAVLLDEDLLAHDVIWAAAGSPNAVVRLTARELVSISGGTVVPIK